MYDLVVAILERHDPMRLLAAMKDEEDVGSDPDAYDPEASTIAPRLRGVTSRDAVVEVVRDEFAHWFDDEPVHGLQAIADDIWAAIQPADRTGG